MNKSCVVFDPNVRFEVLTRIQNTEWDLSIVILAFNSATNESVPGFRIEFEKLIQPILDGFASLESLWLYRMSVQDVFTFAQDLLIAERGKLTILAPDETGPYAVEIRCGKFHDVVNVEYELLTKLVELT